MQCRLQCAVNDDNVLTLSTNWETKFIFNMLLPWKLHQEANSCFLINYKYCVFQNWMEVRQKFSDKIKDSDWKAFCIKTIKSKSFLIKSKTRIEKRSLRMIKSNRVIKKFSVKMMKSKTMIEKLSVDIKS